MALNDLSLRQLLLIHNHLLPESGTKKFADKESALRRTMEAIKVFARSRSDGATAEDYAIRLHPEGSDEQLIAAFGSEEEAVAEGQQVEATNVPAPTGEPKARGRKPGTSKLNGSKFVPTKQVNPRRAGTHGWRSYNILLANPAGIEYGAYIAAGGRANDLAWDITHKNTKQL
jgi:hypothetical protein